MQLRLHNTLTRQKEDFRPIDPANLRLYVCGPTVYQRIHVGNARAFVVFDVLYRLLRHLYGAGHVTYVRNITDIDDKIIDQARKDGVDIRELTERTAGLFREDLAALGCLPPTHEPRATEHIPGMVALIETLIARGHAYAADGHVLFSVPSMPAYGRLSRRDREEQIAGARVDVAPYKQDPADFVLWKPSAPDQPGWDSPWGRGRPGWHIECSAMSEAFLAPLPFDIHAGGLDLIFPHHENEIAQSCCAHGIERMATYWLHNGFLDMRGEKMSKSLGNVVRVSEALDVASGEAVRMHLLGTHYRQPADFNENGLIDAHNTLRRFYRVLAEADVPAQGEDPADGGIIDYLSDDLNTPSAIAHLHALATAANKAASLAERRDCALRLRAEAAVLGLLQDNPDEFLKRRLPQRLSAEPSENESRFGDLLIQQELSDGAISDKLQARADARKLKQFAVADAIRKELEAAGIMLKDRPDGSTDWERR